jgi:hypothetical protein
MPSLPRRRFRRLVVALSGAVVVSLATGAVASAATTVSLGGALTSAGVKAPKAVALTVAGTSSSDGATVTDLGGSVTLTVGKRSVTLTALQLTTVVRTQLAAKVSGSARVALFDVSGSNLSLTSNGAKALSKRLGVKLRSGASAGRIAMDTTTAPAAGKAITGGTITWGYDTAIRTVFQSSFTPAVSGGVAQGPDGLFALPVTGGSYDAATRTGSVTSKGGFRIGYVLSPADAAGAHGIWVTLGNVGITFNGTTGTLTATSESGYHDTQVVAMGTRTIATLDLSTPPVASADGKTLTWTAIPATIAPGGDELVQNFKDSPGRPSLGDVHQIDPVTISVQLG